MKYEANDFLLPHSRRHVEFFFSFLLENKLPLTLTFQSIVNHCTSRTPFANFSWNLNFFRVSNTCAVALFLFLGASRQILFWLSFDFLSFISDFVVISQIIYVLIISRFSKLKHARARRFFLSTFFSRVFYCCYCTFLSLFSTIWFWV